METSILTLVIQCTVTYNQKYSLLIHLMFVLKVHTRNGMHLLFMKLEDSVWNAWLSFVIVVLPVGMRTLLLSLVLLVPGTRTSFYLIDTEGLATVLQLSIDLLFTRSDSGWWTNGRSGLFWVFQGAILPQWDSWRRGGTWGRWWRCRLCSWSEWRLWRLLWLYHWSKYRYWKHPSVFSGE